jgi:hypothetical protein
VQAQGKECAGARPARGAARAARIRLGVRPEVGDDHRAPPVSETQKEEAARAGWAEGGLHGRVSKLG